MLSSGRFPFCLEASDFALKAFNWLGEDHPHYEVNFLYLKSTDYRCSPHLQNTFRVKSRLVLEAVNWYYSQAKSMHKTHPHTSVPLALREREQNSVSEQYLAYDG